METAVAPSAFARHLHSRFAELSVVRLRHDVAVDDRVMPAGSIGTVVHAYGGGAAYEVEFARPFHAVLTLETADIAP